jgi:hypothetical protein
MMAKMASKRRARAKTKKLLNRMSCSNSINTRISTRATFSSKKKRKGRLSGYL